MIKHRQTTSLWAWLTSTLHRHSFGIIMLSLGLLATTPVGSSVPGIILAVMAVQLIVGRGEPVFPRFIMTRCNVAPAMVISLISLAYIEEDGLLLSVALLAARLY